MNNKSLVEALLYVSGKPVTKEEIIEILNKDGKIEEKEIYKLIQEIREEKEKADSGIELVETDGRYQFVVKKEEMEKLSIFLDQRPNPKLTPVNMEVLSIIAYNQGITRAEIEKIRGVSSDVVVSKLLDYGLIEEAGRRESIGRPMMYKTTNKFLLTFGLEKLEDLPSTNEVKIKDEENI